MNSPSIGYSFGPVPSRRLGRSLGINNIPAKVCTYACRYCQLGPTSSMHAERVCFYHPERIADDVGRRLDKARQAGEAVDYLTFVPDGEPTLDANLGRAIELLKPLGVLVGVITNSSLIWRADVRAELGLADWVSVKIDAAEEAAWHAINRPLRSLSLTEILDGIREFASVFNGELVTETMLVSGLNCDAEILAQTASFISEIKPSRAYLSIPTRPPADPRVLPPDTEELNRAYQGFSEHLPRVEYLIGYEGDAFATTGDAVRDLLSITAVHPMRREAVARLLKREAASWDVVTELIAQGDLAELEFDGNVFYLRKPKHYVRP
ncbi:radical SAM protein [bacterium]|nr:radical SAM protein [bacterium]